MNKMKKLLSVVLAVVLAFSALSVLGSAAKANYKTVAELEALDAYSPYGQVTRLSTEERASIVQDFLDSVLPGLGINMGEVFNVLGLSITLDLSSIDRLCYSLDTVKSTLDNWLAGIAMAIVNLGVLEQLSMDTWASGYTRASTSTTQLALFAEFLELLSNNTTLVNSVLTNGLDLGLVAGMIGGNLDLTSINAIVTDLPALVKGLIFGLFERWDDTTSEIQTLENAKVGNGNVETTVNNFVKNLFKNDMRISTVKVDANGNVTSDHNLPGAGADARVRYTVNGNVLTATTYATKEYVDAQAKLGKTVAVGSYYVSAKYVLEPEVGTSDYIWHQVNIDEDGNMKTLEDGSYDYVGGETPNLKYYELDSQLLPGFDANIDLSTMSAGDLLYTFIPYVFEDMAPVVLNGSVKKILAEFFGAKFTYVGDVGSDAVNALPDSNNAIFTEEQGDYMFEWSDYAVINGNHYYRYLDQIFAGDISNKNNYFDIVNWDYEITADFMNEFIPANDDDASVRLLENINNFLIKVAKTAFKASANTTDSASDYTATWTMPAFVEGGNENLVDNLKMAAQAVIKLAPQHIFGSDYATNPRCYYNLLISTDDDTVLTGLAAQLVDIIMPSMTLPSATEIEGSGAKVGAILAAVVREFAAYLVPEYNFDALIYTDFGTTTADPVKSFVKDKDSNYWLDVILTMAINIGFEYIRAFADMGEGTAEWDAFVAYSGYAPDGKTYAAMTGDELRAHWEGMLDYVVDWALSTEKEWTWKMANLVETDGFTVSLTTAEDPWVKLDKILFGIIPFDELLTIETTEYGTRLEQFLRHDLILGLVDLRWEDLFNTLQFNGTNKYFRTDNVLDQLAKLVKNILNGLLDKIGGGDYKFVPDAVTDFDSLATQANIRTLAVNLVGKLYTAYNNGLLDTVLPILNMFVGWKTADPQTIADPIIWTTFRDGNDYAFQYNVALGGTMDAASTLIHFQNNSSGMLETHRNSSVTDHAYEINIKSVTSNAKTNKLSFEYDNVVSPWETVDIKVGGTYNGEEAVTVTVAYDYVGKDGKAVGGTQYTAITFLISNQYEDAQIEGRKDGDVGEDYGTVESFGKYQFTEDLYSSVTGFTAIISSATGGTLGTSTQATDWKYTHAPQSSEVDCDGNQSGTYYWMDDNAAQYFEYYQGRDGGWATQKPAEGATSGLLYKAKAGVTADTEFAYGAYYMGIVCVKYGSGEKDWETTFIYYNDHGIDEVYAENMNNGYHAYMGVDEAIYNEYADAWQWIVYGATYPMMTAANGHAETDFVTAIQPYIPAAIERFEAAKEAFEEALAQVDASAGDTSDIPESVQELEAQLAIDVTDEEKGTKEVNFQDYEFYEYFNYADLRTSHRNFVKTYYAPEIMDTYYIMGSGIREAELNDVIAAEDNEFIAAGIEASKLENDPALVAESIAANENWKMPVNSDLLIEDMTARLAYYKQFLIKEDADHKYFLDQEIAHVEAQGLNAADYEAVTWGRFADALAVAKAVSAGNDDYASFNSRIYDVKYNLMVAYKQLLKKADSLIGAGGTADLMANADKANEIFASLAAGDGAWTLKDGVDADAAYAALIQALGYYYVGEDGNTYNLFADSALEYIDNDRPNKTANQAKVNAANTALVAAMDNFVAAEPEEPAEPNTLVLNENAPFEAIIDLVNGGEFTGAVYGFDTLGWNDEWIVDGTIADFVTTAYGDEYLEVIVGDSGVETTGAVINVLDYDGNVVESYVYIYFGDMDMDGGVGFADALIAEFYEMNFTGIDTLYQFMAGDLDSDTMPGFSDALVMEYWETNYMGMPLQSDVGAVAVGNVYEIF